MSDIEILPTQDTVKQCEIDLAAKRDRLSQSMSLLRERVVEVSHWRTHVNERPGTALLVALAAGLLVGSLLLPPPRRR